MNIQVNKSIVYKCQFDWNVSVAREVFFQTMWAMLDSICQCRYGQEKRDDLAEREQVHYGN